MEGLIFMIVIACVVVNMVSTAAKQKQAEQKKAQAKSAAPQKSKATYKQVKNVKHGGTQEYLDSTQTTLYDQMSEVQAQGNMSAQGGRVHPTLADRPTMQPTISLSNAKDVWAHEGSMAGQSTEGVDPCHNEQMNYQSESADDRAAMTQAAAEGAGSPLKQLFTPQNMVQAVVMSEILNRPKAGKRRAV